MQVCPEVEVGMGTPRETLRLVRTRTAGLRMLTTRTGIDHTDAMDGLVRRGGSTQLAREDLSGYVLKKDSPSCGMERVKVYRRQAACADGTGAASSPPPCCARFPLCRSRKKDGSTDPRLRENFIERVFAFRRLTQLFAGRWTVGQLVAFHTAHKMSLLAHSTPGLRRARPARRQRRRAPRADLPRQYATLFMETLRIPATTRRHANVLLHMAGHLKRRLDDASKRELLACIDEYRHGMVPLVVPLTLIRHYVRAFDIAYLAGSDLPRAASAGASPAQPRLTANPAVGARSVKRVTHIRWRQRKWREIRVFATFARWHCGCSSAARRRCDGTC